MEPRYNNPIYNKFLGITTDFVYSSNTKIYGEVPRYNEALYGGCILSVPWHFVITRFHCNLASGAEFAIVSFKVNVTFFFSVNLEHNSLTSFGGLVYLVNLKVPDLIFFVSSVF